MADFRIRNVPANVYTEIRRDSKKNRRSINAEVLSLIADRAEMSCRRRQAANALKNVHKLWEEIGDKKPNQSGRAALNRVVLRKEK